MKWPRRVAALPIRFYRRFLSPLKPPTCRFHPTCSEYGLDALRVHGVVKGTLLTCWRILRCQPFCKGGYDPVPPRGRWRSEVPSSPAREPREPGDDEKRNEPR